MQVVKAGPSDFETVQGFYDSLIDERRRVGHNITWVKGVYPSPTLVRESLERGELYLGVEDDQIAAAMVLNCRGNDGYEDAPWHVEAGEGEAMVIHALGVHPRFGGRGIGAQMTQCAIALAREAGMKAVRLDVLESNAQARRIYASCGFEHVTLVKLYYDNTGLTEFELMEHVL
ncbi:MAG: GNAT family N-acetyltransferase [Atopobiaceae bacterium]|nr:GNAT family N-acetyltransferase [Atopobiaceae bacterium]